MVAGEDTRERHAGGKRAGFPTVDPTVHVMIGSILTRANILGTREFHNRPC